MSRISCRRLRKRSGVRKPPCVWRISSVRRSGHVRLDSGLQQSSGLQHGESVRRGHVGGQRRRIRVRTSPHAGIPLIHNSSYEKTHRIHLTVKTQERLRNLSEDVVRGGWRTSQRNDASALLHFPSLFILSYLYCFLHPSIHQSTCLYLHPSVCPIDSSFLFSVCPSFILVFPPICSFSPSTRLVFHSFYPFITRPSISSPPIYLFIHSAVFFHPSLHSLLPSVPSILLFISVHPSLISCFLFSSILSIYHLFFHPSIFF